MLVVSGSPWNACGAESWWLPVTSGLAGPRMAVRLIHGGCWVPVGRAGHIMAAKTIFRAVICWGIGLALRTAVGLCPPVPSRVISWLAMRHCQNTEVGRALSSVHPQIRWRFPIWCHQCQY